MKNAPKEGTLRYRAYVGTTSARRLLSAFVFGNRHMDEVRMEALDETLIPSDRYSFQTKESPCVSEGSQVSRNSED